MSNGINYFLIILIGLVFSIFIRVYIEGAFNFTNYVTEFYLENIATNVSNHFVFPSLKCTFIIHLLS